MKNAFPAKSMVMVALLSLVIAFTLSRFPALQDYSLWGPSGNQREHTAVGTGARGVEERLETLMNQAGREWLEKLEEMERKSIEMTRRRLESMQGKWQSEDRLDAFCDEYYGYFKGFRMVWLTGKDLFVDGQPNIESELADMMEKHLFFDVQDDLAALFLDMEQDLRHEASAFQNQFLETLEKTFTSEELAEAKKILAEQAVGPGTSTFQTFARTYADFKTPTLIGALGLSSATQLATGAGTKALLKSIPRFLGGIGIFIAVDFAVSKAIRIVFEDDTRQNLRTDVARYRAALEKSITSEISRTFDNLAATLQ